MNKRIDISDDHYIQFTTWKPDRKLNPQYKDLPDLDPCGLIMYHKTPEGKECSGSIMFESDVAKIVFSNQPVWTVESLEPLTLSPSLLCVACKDHGYIREGKWVKV